MRPSRLDLAGVLVAAAALCAPRAASADPTPTRHAAYLELLGKGSLWGAGYDYQPSRWFAFGAVGSFFVVRGERVTSFSPYVGAYPLGHDRHRLFVQGGPLLVHKQTPSPVPEWPGDSDTGLAAELSAGYEYRNGFLLRGFGMVSAGKGGVYPRVGLSLGWSL
jgi:hypothetical protein